jgi:hypothetical protein
MIVSLVPKSKQPNIPNEIIIFRNWFDEWLPIKMDLDYTIRNDVGCSIHNFAKKSFKRNKP